MAIHAPHFPDLLFEDSLRLRRWEAALLARLTSAGYRELRPSLVSRDARSATQVRFFDGDELVALRSDFTLALAALLAARFVDPPERLAYSGAVFRRPSHPFEVTERFEVGCELVQPSSVPTQPADLELLRLLTAVPEAIGLKGGIVQLGHVGLVRRPLEAEALPTRLQSQLIAALSRRALHRASDALVQAAVSQATRERLVAHCEALLQGTRAALDESPYAALLESERGSLAAAERQVAGCLPAGLELRVDPADVQGIDFYTGPTLRLWAPGARQELAAGGRYDQLFPSLGRSWSAAGFCVRLSALVDLAGTHPELFA